MIFVNGWKKRPNEKDACSSYNKKEKSRMKFKMYVYLSGTIWLPAQPRDLLYINILYSIRLYI